jgi:uncharacterized protein
MSLTLLPVEYHHFQSRGRWLLFDVNALTVIPSCALDRTILETAAAGLTARQLESRVVASDDRLNCRDVARRIRVLTKRHFLLRPGETPGLAELRPPTSYATFMVNVSQRCNLTCPYCYVNKGLFDYEQTPIARMESATADQLVEKIHQAFPAFETYGYHFYGGEPLMNFDAIRRIVEAAETKSEATGTKTDYHITTNGTLLTREVADFMDRHRFTVYFSIDGDQENHDELRRYVNGRGSYRDVEKNLAYLKTRPGVHLIGSSVIRRGFTLGKALDLLEDHGARQCKAERVRLKDGDALSLQGAEHDAYVRDIEALIEHYIGRLSSGRKPMDFRLSSKILQVMTRVRRNFFCPAGDRMFGVSADGELYPCALHVGRPQSRIGDIRSGVDPEKQKAFRARFGWEGQEDCRSCWTRHLCGGGCSAMVDRFGHEDCRSLRAESEAAIAIYQHFAERDPVLLYGLVSPKIARWINGELEDPDELMPSEPAAQRLHRGSKSTPHNAPRSAEPSSRDSRAAEERHPMQGSDSTGHHRHATRLYQITKP